MSTDLDYPGIDYSSLLFQKTELPKPIKPQKKKIYGSRNAIKRLKKARKEK
jgi:hypothetical protein